MAIVERLPMKSFAMMALFTALGIPGPDLLLRACGRRAFPMLEKALLDVPTGQSLALDLDGVSVIDTSFADETLLELALGLIHGHYGDRFLVLDRPSPATIENLEGTIARRRAKVALPIREDGRMRLVGHVEPNLAEAWELAQQVGTLTARGLADRLGLEINTASMRLHKLYNARLLARREVITPSGRQHIYQLPA